MTIDIISGSTVPGLAANVARRLGVKAHYPNIARFPDGEIRVIEGDYTPQPTVAYVQTMHPRPNDTLVEMMFTVDLLKDLGAKRVIAVVPYLGYTRQDTRHEKGEAISVKSMLKALDFTGVDDILSVDIHLHRLSLAGDVGLQPDQDARGQRGGPAGEEGRKKPDEAAGDRAGRRVGAVGGEGGGAAGHGLRRAGEDAASRRKEIHIRPRKLDAKGRDVLIIDDIVSTGGTIMEVIKSLKAQGAGRITAACTHAVLSDIDTLTGLFRAGMDEFIATNTINNEFGIVDVSGIIADKLREIT